MKCRYRVLEDRYLHPSFLNDFSNLEEARRFASAWMVCHPGRRAYVVLKMFF